MTIYWLFLAFPALMALTYPRLAPRYSSNAAQGLALLTFVLFYALLAGLRYEVGGDWLNYIDMYEDMRTDSLGYALTRTDPLFGLFNWISAQIGTGVYLVNFLCGMILGLGVVRAAMRFREPWLAILIAVPYLLIVVGLGYVRQGLAIGFVLIAITSLDRARPLRTAAYLVLAVLSHSTAALALPLFGYALARRYKAFAVIFSFIGAVLFLYVLAPRLGQFELGYIDQEYDSGGATVRLLMSLLPSLLLLARYRAFVASERVRSVWILVALANVAALVALFVTPSSTAVDRIALFYSIIQLAVFGEFRDLSGLSARYATLIRLLLIAIAVAVQSVWLIFATNAEFWVPYQSVLQFL